MTLLSILVGLGLEYFLGTLDRVRNFTWFGFYRSWLEARCGKMAFWAGPGGVLLTLGIPLVILAVITNLLSGLSVILSFILAVFIFAYCIGSDVNSLLDDYVDALVSGDEGSVSGIETQLTGGTASADSGGLAKLQTILVRAHNDLFGVIFWFIVIGPVGALLYSLAMRMLALCQDLRGAYADAVRNLVNLLIWPSARLLAVGFALAGSLVDALEGWREVKGHTLDNSVAIIKSSGIGAIQFRPADGDAPVKKAEYLSRVQEIQALINRTLIIWLTILGLMTLRGVLG
jgi:membrane protein required for beta-lactamase induction